MKAAVYDRYGPPEVVRLADVERPEPGNREILVRTRATTVTSGDWRARSLDVPTGFKVLSRLFFGIRRPRRRVLGTELAGEVEAVGPEVRRFQTGDPVLAFRGVRMGCHAEYVCLPEDGCVAAKPGNLTFEEAAALCFGGTTALDFFRRGKLQAGEEVLVNGASGGVGTAAVQLARHLGAKVTGVCSAANVELVRSLGADQVIDYTEEDFTKSGRSYDVIVDTVGNAGWTRSRGVLKEKGRLLLVMGELPDMLRSPWVGLTSGRKIIAGPAGERPEDVQRLAELAADGHFRPVIDRVYPFEQIVEAHRHVETRHKKGNVVVTLDRSGGD